MEDFRYISDKVQKVLDLIKNKEMNNQQYFNLYQNTLNYEDISDYEREILTEKLVSILRIKFPKQSSKILGNKSTDAQELLEEILTEIKKEFSWDKNRVGSHVKVGGSMVSGKEFVCWYISYKNSKGISCGLGYHQQTPNDLPYLEVVKKEVNKNSNFIPVVKHYPVHSKDLALDDFRLHLLEIVE